jgi:Fe-S-cluster-containing dehydrogenase component
MGTTDDIPRRTTEGDATIDRRAFLRTCALATPVLLGSVVVGGQSAPDEPAPYDPKDHYYGMAIDVGKCIGCGNCMEACRTENAVPAPHVRTWVERYTVHEDDEVTVEAVREPGERPVPRVAASEAPALRSFFVPKLCNQCANAPCVQVCPVGATFTTPDGVTLVDHEYCIGCSYCIQACPYGARFLDPVDHTAQKCTFCYHRVTRGLAPACVEVCPTGARVFGEVGTRNSPLTRFMRFSEIQVLKAHLNTEPKVYYAGLDGKVV